MTQPGEPLSEGGAAGSHLPLRVAVAAPPPAHQRPAADAADRRRLPDRPGRPRPSAVPAPGRRQPRRAGWRRRRLRADRPELLGPRLLPLPPLGGRRRLRCHGLRRHQPRPGQPEAPQGRCGQLAEAYRRTQRAAPRCRRPIDAVTRSGSGLDPHISPANAALQVPRIAQERRTGAKGRSPTRGRTHLRPAARLPRRARAWRCSPSTWPSTGPTPHRFRTASDAV